MSVGIDFSTDAIIKGAQRRTSTPLSQSLFTPDDFVSLINNHMVSIVIPMIKSVSEEYFVVHYDQPMTTSQSSYTIPTRALGGALRDIVLVNSNGQEIAIPRLQPEMVKYGGTYFAQRMFGVFVEYDHVTFFPDVKTIPSNTLLRLKYERRPNDLCLTSNASTITVLDSANIKITLASVPSAWTTNTTVDIIVPVPQFLSVGDDIVITNITGNVLTLSTWPTSIAVGQWVSESLTSPVAQLPYEAHKLLEQLGAISLLEAQRDTQGQQTAETTFGKMAELFYKIITPRIEGSARKVINRNSIFDYNRGWSSYMTVR